MPSPTFSLLITNRNYGRFLEASVGSCLEQEYPSDRFEVIVVDDESTDDSPARLEGIRTRCALAPGQPEFRWIGQSNTGQGGALATAIAQARNDYLCFLDADDYFERRKLSRLAECISVYESVSRRGLFVSHDLRVLEDRTGTFLGQTLYDLWKVAPFGVTEIGIQHLDRFHPFSIPAGITCSRVLVAGVAAQVDLERWKTSGDQPFVLAAFLASGVVHHIHESLGVYRIHEDNRGSSLQEGKLRLKRPWTSQREQAADALAHCERVIDDLALSPRERSDRLGYVRRVERTMRVTSSARGLRRAPTSIVLLPGERGADPTATLESITAQSVSPIEVVTPMEARGDLPSGIEHRQYSTERPGRSHAMQAALARCRGSFVLFVEPDDLLDPHFLERHEDLHAHRALCMISSSDVRVVDVERRVLHAQLLTSLGLWKRDFEFIAPFAEHGSRPFGLHGASLVRRTSLAELFFDAPLPDALSENADTAFLWFCSALGGTIRLRECLGSLRTEQPVGYVHGRIGGRPFGAFRGDVGDELSALRHFARILVTHEAVLRAQLGPAWVRGFARWVAGLAGEDAVPDADAFLVFSEDAAASRAPESLKRDVREAWGPRA